MDHEHGMIDDSTPWNPNISYTGAMAGIIAGLTVVIALRHVLNYIPSVSNTSVFLRYSRAERFVINKCSYTLTVGAREQPVLPPVGAVLLIVVLLSTALPLLLVQADLKLNSNRAGFLAISMVPFLLASTGKNSAMALITGISRVKLNYLHKALATTIVVLTTIHMAYMFRAWSPFSWFLAEQLESGKVRYGLAGYGCLLFVFLTSLYPIRRYYHEVFLTTHLVSFGFIGAIAKHTPYAMRYFFTGLLCYCLNAMAGWCVKSRLARARVEVLNNCTRLSIRLSSPIVHHPGQHIYINLPRISYFEWHPFTITSIHVAEDSACDMVEVHVFVRGNYTKMLFESVEQGEDLVAFVSGPYGTRIDPIKDILLKHDSVVLMSAGAGVTFPMRLLRELASRSLESSWEDAYRTTIISFGWCVRASDELRWFRSEVEQMMVLFEQAHKNDSRIPSLQVSFYVTQSSGEDGADAPLEIEPLPTGEKREGNRMIRGYQSSTSAPIAGVEYGGRIDPAGFIKEASGQTPGVFVCGPSSFNAACRNAVASLSRPGFLPQMCIEEFEF